jgi:hypothetical protein
MTRYWGTRKFFAATSDHTSRLARGEGAGLFAEGRQDGPVAAAGPPRNDSLLLRLHTEVPRSSAKARDRSESVCINRPAVLL